MPPGPRGSAFAGASRSQVRFAFLPEVPAYASARVLVVVAVVAADGRGVDGRHRRANPVRPVLREEQHPLRQVRLAHLHDGPLRDLLLPRARAAHRTRGRLRRERLSADQRRPQARPLDEGAADPLQDAQRVRAGERRPERRPGRRRRLRRTDAAPHGDADRRAARPALRPHRPRADAPVRVRHHSAGPQSAETSRCG